MFTGIIEAVQPVQNVQPTPTGLRLGLDLGSLADDARLGDSIAINGVCLTINQLQDSRAWFDIMAQTLKVSTLKALKPGQKVNLERAMAANGRFGGHFVQGHVDGIGRVDHIDSTGCQWTIWIVPPAEVMNFIIPKGSIAIDGVSLTIADISNRLFCVSLIPTTLNDTNLGDRRPGDSVNLEADLIGKWIARRLHAMTHSDKPASRLSLEDLHHQGFA